MNELVERLKLMREIAVREDRCGDDTAYRDAIKALEAADRMVDGTNIPLNIAEQVIAMGRVEWGATAEHNDAGHIAHLAESLRMTREHFSFEDIPVRMHGLYLEGTNTVLCHTGTSPNSGQNAQALAGAWNWLHKQALTAYRTATQKKD